MTRHAVGVPTVGEYGDPRLIVDLARSAEEAGWDGLFCWEHLLYHDPTWPVADSTVALAAAAEATDRLRLGILVTALPRRRPQRFAREAVTLDLLSGGRLVCGVGLGSMDREYEAFGEDPDLSERGRRLDEALGIVTALWSGEPVQHGGGRYRVENVTMHPRPVQQPRIPVWCAGRWPAKAPFRRAARYDGVMPTAEGYGKGTTLPPATLREILDVVAAERGDLRGFDVALEGTTEGAGGEETVAAYAEAGLTWWVEALGWWRGGVGAARARVEQGPPR